MVYVFFGVIGIILLLIPSFVYLPFAESMNKPTREQRRVWFENGGNLPVRKKDKNVAVMLALFLGSFGIHKAYLTREVTDRNGKLSHDCANGVARFIVSESSLFFAFLVASFNLLSHGEFLSPYGGRIAFVLCIPFFVMVGLGIKDGCKLNAMSEEEFHKTYNKGIVDKTDKEHNDFNDAVDFLMRRKKDQ